ncbi:hypothetical protein JRI60_07915 [Archangium violaceum]|uniref:hypothetical protein n=1 Tax=Archangium violaceum TaxID=83451 RepID=UPI00194F3E8E|nr:hypothetical protein [Archangium violaceum]QRN98945.1 hypothetical protein JRI60_07915 [Archangium violaceum]
MSSRAPLRLRPRCKPLQDVGRLCFPETADTACNPGHTCVLNPMNRLSGTCEAGRAEGQACEHSGQCASQLCATPPGASRAVCLRLPGLGEDCTTGGKCTADEVCGAESGGVRTCYVKRFQGTACSRDMDCLSGVCADLNRIGEVGTPGKFCRPCF